MIAKVGTGALLALYHLMPLFSEGKFSSFYTGTVKKSETPQLCAVLVTWIQTRYLHPKSCSRGMLQSTLASHSSALTQQRKQSLVKEAKIGTCQSRGGSEIQQPIRRLSISTAWLSVSSRKPEHLSLPSDC